MTIDDLLPGGQFTKTHLIKTMDFFHKSLSQEASLINALNVFPVPDGDTGTNMAATAGETFAAAVELLEKNQITDYNSSETETLEMAQLCKSLSRGSLMGARGNSGVILCQIIRAFCDAISPVEKVDGKSMVFAFRQAADAAWKSVQKPVKGTILSVAEGAASQAESIVADGTLQPEQPDVSSVLRAALQGSLEALAATTDQLEVLHKAGLVDSGGAGLTLFYGSLLAAYENRDRPQLVLPESSLAKISSDVNNKSSEEPFFGQDKSYLDYNFEQVSSSLAELKFEVMYFLEAADEVIQSFRQALEAIGDSIVVVGGDGLYNCHVHTDDAGAAIEAALDIGKPRQIRITYLPESAPADRTEGLTATTSSLSHQGQQLREEIWVREALEGHSAVLSAENEIVDTSKVVHPDTVVVAVSVGEGISRLFISLGVAKIIFGFQTMNPSTKDILAAVAEFTESDVIILPNNPNIIAVAGQAAELANQERDSKRVYVLPTKTIQEALAALVDFDPMAAGEDNLTNMAKAIEHLKTGEITVAVRDSSFGDKVIKKGDYIGITRSAGIAVVERELSSAVTELLRLLIEPGDELVTIIEGLDYDESSSRIIKDWLEVNYKSVGLERLKGGQPIYNYLISVE